MTRTEHSSPPQVSHSDHCRAIARRLADGHRSLDDGSLLSLVSGSVVDDLADALSDIDMSIVLDMLPAAAVLEAACIGAGTTPWFWRSGEIAEGGLVVAFYIEGVEAQICYSSHARLNHDIDELLLRHNPDTPLHKLGEGLRKAEPLAGAPRLSALKARLAAFPPELGRAMVDHFLQLPTPWRAATQLLERDAALWCREIVVDASYRLLGVLCGLNGRWFTRFQLKRMHKLAAELPLAPTALADRLEGLLQAPPRAAFDALHALEIEVLDLVAQQRPELDLSLPRQRLAAYRPVG